MKCAGCSTDVEIGSGERVGFRDTCPGCAADLHTCLQCRHHDPAAYNGCREPGAERVSDAERANRCEWFAPRIDSPGEGAGEKTEARAQFDDLFKK